MFSNIINIIKDHISYITVFVIMATGMITLIYDGKIYKAKGFIKELKIIKIISCFYIALGIIMLFIL